MPTEKPAQSDFILPAVANGQKALLAGLRLQAHGFKAVMRYQIEALAFLKHRYEQDVKLLDDLASGGDANSLDVFGTFVQNAMNEYTKEIGKVASINSKLASETVKRVHEEVEASVEDAAARSVA